MAIRAPLDAGLPQYDEEIDALLPSHSMGSKVVSINSVKMNTGEVLQWIAEIRER
jgi:hypothetical protein